MSHERRSRLLWWVSLGIISCVWALYFGVIVTLLPPYQWMTLSLELLVASAMMLVVANAVIHAPRKPGAMYHFVIVWGISLPLLVGYLSSLNARSGSASVLKWNIMIIVLLYAWAMLILRIWEARTGLGGGWHGWHSGLAVSIVGAGIFAGTWGWFTLGGWPMMPYWDYMTEKPLLYLGLGLGFLGAYLIRPKEGREGSQMVGRLPLKSMAVLVTFLVVATLYFTFPPLLLFALVLLVFIYWERTQALPKHWAN